MNGSKLKQSIEHLDRLATQAKRHTEQNYLVVAGTHPENMSIADFMALRVLAISQQELLISLCDAVKELARQLRDDRA